MDLSRLYASIESQGAQLPVDTWHPPFCGDIDMVIRADGSWHYNGTPINRPAMVQLFSRILRREDDGYVLVTPVEKVGIRVEDVPFIAVEMMADAPLTFRTQVGDIVTPDTMRFETADGFKPYIVVRNGLEARLSRSLAQDIAARVTVIDGWLGVPSRPHFFRISPSHET